MDSPEAVCGPAIENGEDQALPEAPRYLAPSTRP